jgi:hypothetical protein
MNTTLIIIIVTIIVMLVMFVGMPYLMKYINKNNIPIESILEMSKKATELAAQLAAAMSGDPKTKGFLTIATQAATMAVKYAEQLYLSGKIEKAERKEKAFEFITNSLKDSGIEVTIEQCSLIYGLIEASVYLLPTTSDNVKFTKLAKKNK